MDEIALIHKITSGDTESFRYLYRLYASSAWQLAIGICKHQANAEDAVQNSFLAAYKYIGTFQHQSSFKTWLLRIVFNEAIRIQKKEKVYRWEEFDATENNEEALAIDGSFLLQQKETKERVRKTISSMNDKEALVLNLFYLEELSVKEIALILGYTEANVKVMMHRARKNFKQQFEQVT